MAEFDLPFSRLRYNVDKKRGQIATHQAELVEMERELQLRCDHFDIERFQEKTTSDDFHNREMIVNVTRCKTCGFTRKFAA
jgi:hypothetical protein